MWDLVLICKTNDTREDGCPHFRLYLGPDVAADLLRYHQVYDRAAASTTEVHCVELFRTYGDWGRVGGFDDDGRGPWYVAGPVTRLKRIAATELATVKATERGLIFAATWANDDSGRYFETPELPWHVLAGFDDANCATAPPELLPNADINELENTLVGGHYIDERGDEITEETKS